ncbi:MAG: IS110 family transposase [Saprospiraceae bacterium]
MKKFEKLEIVNMNCAGIDVGSKSHFVAIGQDDSQVKEFGVSTPDFTLISQYLRLNGITSIAMESTGSYFQSLFMYLQQEGFEVMLIHGGAIKQVNGRKTDVVDCKRIQKLYSLGLLNSCFLPSVAVNEARIIYRHRLNLIEESSRPMNRINKTLRMMNIRIDNAISDIGGKTGQSILMAIVKGERDAKKLASLADPKIKKSKKELESYLEGMWNENHLFVLKDCYESYQILRNRIRKCDAQLENTFKLILDSQGSEANEQEIKLEKKQRSRNSLNYNISKISYELYGVDLMQIECISEATLNSLVCEIGRDMSKFETAKHFVSWLRLAPNNKISGGKIISSRTPRSINKFTLTLRNAANTIGNLKSGYLNNFFRKIAYKKGRGAAINATARKMAVIIWKMISKKEDYKPIDMHEYKLKQKGKIIQSIKNKIKQLNINPNELGLDFQLHAIS